MAKPSDSRAHFDADAITAAQEAPTLTVGRFLYRGRLLSVEEWLPFWDRLQAMEAKPAAASTRLAVLALRDRVAFYREYLRAVFPRRDFRFWAPDPVAHLLAQPFDVVEQTVGFFFTLQALATFGLEAMDKATTPATNGTPSPHAIPAPAPASAD